MSLTECIRAAREIAETSLNPADHRYVHALQAVADAEVAALDRSLDPEYDPAGIPPPLDHIAIRKPPPPTGELPTP